MSFNDDNLTVNVSNISFSQEEKKERLKKTLLTLSDKKRKEKQKAESIKILRKQKKFNTSYSHSWTHEETEEDKVIKILKGGFEKKFNMSFEKFIEIYNNILENSPEKLI